MLGLYFVSTGAFVSLPMIWTLTSINLNTPLQKALGSGFVIGIGSSGGFVSAWIFRSSGKPKYHAGMMDGLILTCIALVLTGLAWLYIVVHNKRKKASHKKKSGTSECSVGDQVFMYRA